MAIHALRRLREDFLSADARFPSLRYLWIRGDCCTFPPNGDLIIEAVTQAAPTWIPNTEAKPLWAFYGPEVHDAPDRFTALARMVLDLAIDGLDVLAQLQPPATEAERYAPGWDRADGRIMPDPFWSGGDFEAAEAWCQWMQYLGEESGNPLLQPKVGQPVVIAGFLPLGLDPADEHRTPPADLLLADNANIGRFRMDPSGRSIEDPRFADLLDSVLDGQIDDVAIFDRSLFHASAMAIDALVLRIQELRGEMPPDVNCIIDPDGRRRRDAQQRLESAVNALATANAKYPTSPFSTLPPPAHELRQRATCFRALRPFKDAVAEARGELRRLTPKSGLQAPDATKEAPAVSTAPSKCPVQLSGEGKIAEVADQPATPLWGEDHRIIERLCAIWPKGETKGQLEQKGFDSPNKRLQKIRASHPQWAQVIKMPGKRGRHGYRIG